MKVAFAPSFFNLFEKKLKRKDAWWNKTYELFRYNIPWFFRNIRAFRKELWKYRTWESSYSLSFLRRGLELNKKCIEKYSYEEKGMKARKIAMMNRAILLLRNHCDDNFIELAEKELGFGYDLKYTFFEEVPPEVQESDSKVFERTRKIEEEQWSELWEIIKGRPTIVPENADPDTDYRDGTDIRCWWH